MNRGRFGNSKAAAHVARIPESGLESGGDPLTTRCKFNFAYFCKDDNAGQAFSELSQAELCDLLEKLHGFSKESLMHWRKQKHGKGSTLSVYGAFPKKTRFRLPKHVPHDVEWGRFRIDGAGRLVGFVVPGALHEKRHETTGLAFDGNTFYVVFLDRDHEFWNAG